MTPGVLPDSSAWIDYSKSNVSTPQKVRLSAFLESGTGTLWTCPPVFQEVLQGAKEVDFAKLRTLFLTCRRGRIGAYHAAAKAVAIYRDLRKRGVTIRKPNDCLIAAYAILNDVYLLHNDHDFDPIERYCGLKVID